MLDESSNPVVSPAPRSRVDHLLHIFAFSGLVAAVGTVLLEWPTLPLTLPQHFDATGDPDRWGGRIVLVILSVTAVVVFAFLTLLERVPHRYRYPIEITPRNAPRQYMLARRLVTMIKLWVVWLLLYLILGIIAVGRGQIGSLSFWPVVATILIPLIAVVWYYFAIHAESEDEYPTIRQIARRELDDWSDPNQLREFDSEEKP